MARYLSPVANRQRLRIRFARGPEVKYISHLDLMRLWERVLRRASIPIAYSEGFSPRPRFSFAAPLPVGVTSEWELMDLFLERRVSPHFLITRVSGQLPPGISILEVQEVGIRLPSLQSQVRYVEYRVTVETDKKLEEVELALRSLLTTEHLPWQHTRDKEIRKYDLRALVDDLWILNWRDFECMLGMRLRTSGRAEQVTAALGFTNHPKSIHRTKLILALR